MDQSCKTKAPEPGAGTGLSFLTREGRAGSRPGAEPRGQGSEADSSPGSTWRAGGDAGSATSRPSVASAPRCARQLEVAGAPPRASSFPAAPPPPSLRAGPHSPQGFTFGARPCRLPAPARLRRRREEEGELWVGEATRVGPREGRWGRRARGRESAGLQLQPPRLWRGPHTHSARCGRAGAPRGGLLAAARGIAAPWRRAVRSPWGHLPLGKR